MSKKQKEQIFVENIFGTVSDKRVVYFREKGWFSGGSREDVPLRHVTSVQLRKTRSPIWGIIFILIGLATLIAIVGVIPLAIGILLIWGSPTVVVNTSGGDLSVSKGFPWQSKFADEFVNALRKQLFDE